MRQKIKRLVAVEMINLKRPYGAKLRSYYSRWKKDKMGFESQVGFLEDLGYEFEVKVKKR